MKTITEIEQNLDLIEIGDRKIYLVGTAHVSHSSVDLAQETIRKYKPDSVCIELCEARYKSLMDPTAWQNMDLYKIIKEGKAYVLMAQLALSSMQKRLGKELKIKPGEEMIKAAEAAKEVSAEICLVDRDVKVTLKRAWANTGVWSLIKIFGSVLGSMFTQNNINEEEIERLKHTDALTAAIDEFSKYLPGVKGSLIDERDSYMAEKIFSAPGKTVVAVIGAGHGPGIKKLIGEKIDLAPLEETPPPSKLAKGLIYGIPAFVLILIAAGFVFAGKEIGTEMVVSWILINGTLAAIGSLFALPHPLTFLTAFCAAPITSLNPTIAAGWVAGLSEAYLRKPKVKDLQNIGEDIAELSGFWKNGVTRILLVIAFTNIGSSAGTIIGIGKIASLFK